MSSPRRVDVCIVNYFGADDVRRSVEALGDGVPGRIWLVDNSADAQQLQALQAIAQARSDVELLAPGANLGFGRGCNLAFERSDAEFFLLLNPDAVLAAADIPRLAQALLRDPQLAAVSPRIFWNLQRSFLLPTAFAQTPLASLALSLAARSPGLTAYAAQRYLAHQQALMSSRTTFEVDFVAGAVLLLRRSAVLLAGGLFDPDYFMFYEDSDLSLRLRRAGHRLAIAGDADAVHEYRHKASKGPLMAQARDVYFRKNFPRIHRATHGLQRIDALARPIDLTQWYQVLPRPCATLADFRSQTGDAAVLAFSPSPLRMPAIFRPLHAQAESFTAADWDLLEPAGYAVLLQPAAGAPRWCWFERVTAPAGAPATIG